MFRDLFIFAVSLLFVASSVASQIPSFFDKKTAPRRVEQNTSQQVGAVVPNFTGHWTGTCQGEQIHLFSITIEQTGITFKITDDNHFNGEYELGGVSHQTIITNGDVNHLSTSAVWNPYSQILSLNIVKTEMGRNTMFPMSTDIFALNFSLDHVQMKLEIEAHYFDGAEESGEGLHRTCTLSIT